jgi:hypothetical protein
VRHEHKNHSLVPDCESGASCCCSLPGSAFEVGA